MNSKIQNHKYKECGDLGIQHGRVATQLGWYKFAAGFCHNQSVLDVGCGQGQGLEILTQASKSATGLEVDPRLACSNIIIKDISEVEDNSYDSVACIDVIEHIEKDIEFVKNLVRVSRKQVLVSTPNWTASRCHWPYHVREYTPQELYNIFKPYGKVELYKGSPSGETTFKVQFLSLYFILNTLRNFYLTALPARVLNLLLPKAAKINSHLFIRLEKNF